MSPEAPRLKLFQVIMMTSADSRAKPGAAKMESDEKDQLLAAATGNLKNLELSLKKANNEMKADRYGFTPIHIAALHGRLNCLNLLIERYNGDVNHASVVGWRPIHLVLNKKSGERALGCLNYLIDKGADVNAKNESRVTPLHQAANEGLLDCIVALTEAGADTHAVDAYGKKPVDLSKLRNHRTCVRYLRHAMWKKDKKDLAEEIHKLDQLKISLMEDDYVHKKYKKEQDLFCQLAFCDWLDSKQYNEKHRRSKSFDSHVNSKPQRRRGEIEKLLYRAERYRKDLLEAAASGSTEEESPPPPNSRTQTYPDELDEETTEKGTTDGDFRKTSPTSKRIGNASARGIRQGITLEELKNLDFETYLAYIKEMYSRPNIQLLSAGPVPNPAKISKEELRRCRVPKMDLHRLATPQDFIAKHIYDVQRKRLPSQGQKQESEILMHLRDTLDPSSRRLSSS